MKISLGQVSQLLAVGALVFLQNGYAETVSLPRGGSIATSTNLSQIVAAMKNPKQAVLPENEISPAQCDRNDSDEHYFLCKERFKALAYLYAEQKQYRIAAEYANQIEAEHTFKAPCKIIGVGTRRDSAVSYSLPSLQYALAVALSTSDVKARMYRAHLCSIGQQIIQSPDEPSKQRLENLSVMRQSFMADVRKHGRSDEVRAAKIYVNEVATPLYRGIQRLSKEESRKPLPGRERSWYLQHWAKQTVLIKQSIARAETLNLPAVYVDFLNEEKWLHKWLVDYKIRSPK